MDFLDSLNLDVSNKRSRRVRSWYLYEQFKSLERHQLHAAQKLKDRSFQERILRQELSERKARRQLFDQIGLCHSESKIKRSVKSKSSKTADSVSTEDFYESFCELQDVCLANQTDNASETCSHDVNLCEDDYTTVQEHKDDISYAESVNSVVNVKSDETVTEDLEKEIDEPTVVDEINLYFNEVKDNLERIEQLTELDVDDKIFENDSLYSVDENATPPIVMMDKNVATTCDYNILAMWSKLVSFAYQLVQLNHGNCYVDYGSQFLTAVLACDVLRRGINKMCNFLQPYVSPIKFAEDSDSNDSHKSVTRTKIPTQPSKSKYTSTDKINKTSRFSKHKVTRRYHSEDCWQQCSGSTSENRRYEQEERASESLRSARKFLLKNGDCSDPSKSSYSSIWPDFSNDESTENFLKGGCKCGCKVLNPMLKLSQYFDNVLKEIDDSLV